MFVRCQRPQKEVQQEDKSYIDIDWSYSSLHQCAVRCFSALLRLSSFLLHIWSIASQERSAILWGLRMVGETAGSGYGLEGLQNRKLNMFWTCLDLHVLLYIIAQQINNMTWLLEDQLSPTAALFSFKQTFGVAWGANHGFVCGSGEHRVMCLQSAPQLFFHPLAADVSAGSVGRNSAPLFPLFPSSVSQHLPPRLKVGQWKFGLTSVHPRPWHTVKSGGIATNPRRLKPCALQHLHITQESVGTSPLWLTELVVKFSVGLQTRILLP